MWCTRSTAERKKPQHCRAKRSLIRSLITRRLRGSRCAIECILVGTTAHGRPYLTIDENSRHINSALTWANIYYVDWRYADSIDHQGTDMETIWSSSTFWAPSMKSRRNEQSVQSVMCPRIVCVRRPIEIPQMIRRTAGRQKVLNWALITFSLCRRFLRHNCAV